MAVCYLNEERASVLRDAVRRHVLKMVHYLQPPFDIQQIVRRALGEEIIEYAQQIHAANIPSWREKLRLCDTAHIQCDRTHSTIVVSVNPPFWWCEYLVTMPPISSLPCGDEQKKWLYDYTAFHKKAMLSVDAVKRVAIDCSTMARFATTIGPDNMRLFDEALRGRPPMRLGVKFYDRMPSKGPRAKDVDVQSAFYAFELATRAMLLDDEVVQKNRVVALY